MFIPARSGEGAPGGGGQALRFQRCVRGWITFVTSLLQSDVSFSRGTSSASLVPPL